MVAVFICPVNKVNRDILSKRWQLIWLAATHYPPPFRFAFQHGAVL